MTIENVCILDAGGQFTKIIDRRLRELNVHSEIVAANSDPVDLAAYKAVIISGGPTSVSDKNAPKVDPAILDLGVPVLGICWGMQFIVATNGGEVKQLDKREDGVFEIEVNTDSKLFSGLSSSQSVLLTHGDSIVTLPSDYETIGKSGDIITAVQHKSKPIYGVQETDI